MKRKQNQKNDVIHSYEEFLMRFFPRTAQSKIAETATPGEIGKQMARDTLRHLQELLKNNKVVKMAK